MTVVNALSLGDEGIVVADEQSSNQLRKYNVAQKLHLLNDSFIYGGSGVSDQIQEVYTMIAGELTKAKEQKDDIPLEEVYRIAKGVLTNHHNSLKNEVLAMNLGISLDDLLTGVHLRTGRPLHESAMAAGRKILQSIDEQCAMSILLSGLQDGKFNIYQINTNNGGSCLSRPYGSIGSGADESDKVLSGYVESLPREKREAIDKKEGVVKIIQATNASSSLNVGVGGSPSIAYVTKEKEIIIPTEQQSILASEIVKGLTNGLLDKDFAEDAVFRLVFNTQVEQVEDEMKKAAKDWPKLNRILRGYKS